MVLAARSRIVRAAVMACVLTVATAGAAFSATDGRRVALVIGNGAYTKITALGNPVRDADLIAGKLRSVGFEVSVSVNGSRSELEQAVRSFGRQARGADAALFYYAGHGIQASGQNYLIPVNASVEEVGDLRYEALPLSLVTEELEYADARISLLVLDACRDNPLTRSLRGRGGTRSTEVSKGLASIQRASGMLIAYATAPGQVAYDGDGTPNSPFTQALSDWIDEPGLEVALMFRRVREQVYNATNGKQRPWVEEAILGDFYFQPELTPVALPSTPSAPEPSFEPPRESDRFAPGDDSVATAWAIARSVNTREAYEQFIARYPGSLFASQATVLLSQLSQTAEPANSSVATGSPGAAQGGAPEIQAKNPGTRATTTIRIIEADDDIPGLF